MRSVGGRFQLSANDLVNHPACRHLTRLNYEVAVGERVAPSRWEPTLELLRERGLASRGGRCCAIHEQGKFMIGKQASSCTCWPTFPR